MPGTVLVSVLEVMDLPSSSSSSSISIKVSLGPRSEYQIWESRDLSFPLTTLRDNMLVILQDSKGNQISETGIETRSIVEKGLWDDFFPLKGGGFLHMKLQFILNEDERNQIRMMRESAVKKKHGEFIHSSLISVQSESTPSAKNNVPSSLSLRVNSDWNEETSSAINVQRSVNLSPTELGRRELIDNIEAKPRPAKIPAETVCADEPENLLRGSQPVGDKLPKVQEDKDYEKPQSSMKKTPSVKNMISVFETGLAEDKKPQIKPAPMKVQSDKNITGNLLKNQHLKEGKKVSTETSASTSKRVANPLPQEVLERVLDDHRHQPSAMLKGKRDSGGSPVVKETHQPEISSSRNSPKSDIQGLAGQTCTSIANCDDRHDPFQRSGAWIFPDEAIQFCVTTSGKKMKPSIHHVRKSVSPTKDAEDQQDNVDISNSNEVDRNEKNHMPEELHEVQKSEETDTSGVAFGQALKVALMMGFGTLVLLTRQRNNI